MKSINKIRVLALGASLILSTQVLAQASDPAWAEGEIRKVDKEAKKLTIRHGEIKSLDMPPMTMVFQAADQVDISTLKAGEKVRFKAGRGSGGAFIANEVQPAKP